MNASTIQPSSAMVVAGGLRERRQAAGASQQKVATRVGCSRSTVQGIETGRAGQFSPVTVIRISAALHTLEWELAWQRGNGSRVLA